jgi:chemotaxis protein methyltransferase CheR
VVLSLGCASGEEPLTLAIILAEIGCLTEANIFAMDIDTEALARCQQGLYPSAQLTEIPKSFRKNYFTRVGDQWQIDPNIAKMVTLRQGDLLLSPPLPKCDLILCRNVLIYFSRDQQVSLMRYFHALLKKGGFLVLGKSETLLGKRKAGFASYHARERIYQKL